MTLERDLIIGAVTLRALRQRPPRQRTVMRAVIGGREMWSFIWRLSFAVILVLPALALLVFPPLGIFALWGITYPLRRYFYWVLQAKMEADKAVDNPEFDRAVKEWIIKFHKSRMN